MSYYGEVFNRDSIISRTQSTNPEPLPTDAQKRNADFVALALERLKAEKLAASMPDLAGMFNQIADMTPEQEAALNASILATDTSYEAGLSRLMAALRNPENMEGWE
jgi:hypothetical protein